MVVDVASSVVSVAVLLIAVVLWLVALRKFDTESEAEGYATPPRGRRVNEFVVEVAVVEVVVDVPFLEATQEVEKADEPDDASVANSAVTAA